MSITRREALVTLSAGALSACGGGGTPEATSQAQRPFADAVSGTFTGPRNQYLLTLSGASIIVHDKTGAATNVTVPAMQPIVFSDLTVEPGIGAAARAIGAADLKLLIHLYMAFFNRVPEAAGLKFWIEQFTAGQSIDAIGDSFYAAAVHYSSLTGYSADMTNAQFVAVIYSNVLGRKGATGPGADEVNFWATAIAEGRMTRGGLIRQMLGSAYTFVGNATYGWVPQLLDNKYAVGLYFAVQQGVGYTSPQDNIVKGGLISAAVTPTDIAAAMALIPVTDTAFDLYGGVAALTLAPASATPTALTCMRVTIDGLIATGNPTFTLTTPVGTMTPWTKQVSARTWTVFLPLYEQPRADAVTSPYAASLHVQHAGQGAAVALQVQDLPTYAELGMAQGEIHKAFSSFMQVTIGGGINDLQVLKVLSPAHAAALDTVIEHRREHLAVVTGFGKRVAPLANGTATFVNFGTGSNGAVILDRAGFEVMERFTALVLVDATHGGTIARAPMSAPASGAQMPMSVSTGLGALMIGTFNGARTLVTNLASNYSAQPANPGSVQETLQKAKDFTQDANLLAAGRTTLFQKASQLLGVEIALANTLDAAGEAQNSLTRMSNAQSLDEWTSAVQDFLVHTAGTAINFVDASIKAVGSPNIQLAYALGKAGGTYALEKWNDRTTAADAVNDAAFEPSQSARIATSPPVPNGGLNVGPDSAPVSTVLDSTGVVVVTLPPRITIIDTPITATDTDGLLRAVGTIGGSLADFLAGFTLATLTCSPRGVYAGSYSGIDEGSATATISGSTINGTATSTKFGTSVTATGPVTSSGAVQMVSGSAGQATFTGRLNSSAGVWKMSGTWSNSKGGGTFGLTQTSCA